MTSSVLFLIGIILIAIALPLIIYLQNTIRVNEQYLSKVQEEDVERADIRKFITNLNFFYDSPSLEWQKVFEKDDIEIYNTFTQQQYVDKKGVRTYRVISWLSAEEISVDRMVELLNGGFLTEDLWFKDDFKGGQKIRTVEDGPAQNAWITQYISDLGMPLLQQRDFVYLLARRELDAEEYSLNDHDGNTIERQVVFGYKSIYHPPLQEKLVRATQFPSLDRITLYKNNKIKWEHIMAFHVNGVLSMSLINSKYKAACNVLYHEAANMRNYLRKAP